MDIETALPYGAHTIIPIDHPSQPEASSPSIVWYIATINVYGTITTTEAPSAEEAAVEVAWLKSMGFTAWFDYNLV